jgi:hypothetical protein
VKKVQNEKKKKKNKKQEKQRFIENKRLDFNQDLSTPAFFSRAFELYIL